MGVYHLRGGRDKGFSTNVMCYKKVGGVILLSNRVIEKMSRCKGSCRQRRFYTKHKHNPTRTRHRRQYQKTKQRGFIPSRPINNRIQP